MKTYGLLGYPLTHSFSKSFFEEKFKKESIVDTEYQNFSFKEIKEAVVHLKSLSGLRGFNITIPHKLHITNYLDEVSDVVKAIGSCNCVRVRNDQWSGFNTDVTGFIQSLKPLLKPHHKNALILGTGGVSKAVAYALQQLGIRFTFVSRSPAERMYGYDDLNEYVMAANPIIVNTTPVGMYPHVNEFPHIPYRYITPGHIVYDLIYNPAETLFLKKAGGHGAIIKNGSEMLVIQAEESWKIWNGLRR